MRSDVSEVRRMLSAHDPCPEPPPHGPEAEMLLQRLLASPPPSGRASSRMPAAPRRRYAVLAVVSAFLVLGGAFGVGRLTSTESIAVAATPSPLQLPAGEGKPARAALMRLGDVAAAQPQLNEGTFFYVKLQSWYLNTRVAGESVESQLEPQNIEQWLKSDGSGLVRRTRGGSTDTVRSSNDRRADLLERLSRDPASLRRKILGYPALGQDNADIPNAIERVEGAVDLTRDYGQLPPELQSAVWRMLASEGLTERGKLVDRGGRTGIAFTIDSAYSGLPNRHVLIVDPDTARLLSYESVLTKTAGALNVDVPAVTSYEVFLGSGRVDDLGARPKS